jgi:hypothetical protein
MDAGGAIHMNTVSKLAAVAALALALPTAPSAQVALTKVGAYRMTNPATNVAAANGSVYLPQTDGLHVIDASNPAAPVRVATLPGQYGDVQLAGRTLYATQYVDGQTGVTLIDVTTPSAPAVIGFVAVAGAKALALGPGLVYALCDGAGQNAEYTPPGVRVVSVAVPSAPVVLSYLPLPVVENGAYRIAASGSQVYVAHGQAGVRIIDVSEPASPREAGALALGSVHGVAVAGSYLYVTEHGDYCEPEDYCGPVAGNLRIVDVSRPECPRLVTTFPRPQAPQHIAVVDNVAYMTEASIWMQTNRIKLTAVDVSNPSLPVDVGYYQVQDAGRETAVTNGHAFAFARGSGSYVFDLVVLQAPIAGAPVCPVE